MILSFPVLSFHSLLFTSTIAVGTLVAFHFLCRWHFLIQIQILTYDLSSHPFLLKGGKSAILSIFLELREEFQHYFMEA